jgi:hypothetical protein
MDRRGSYFLFLLGCLALLAPGRLGAQADPAVLRRDIEAAHLDPARAVALKNVKLSAGLATLLLEDGVLVPASPVGGKSIELVFTGRGRIVIEPPDRVEAGQLEMFTGGSRLDEELKEAVLVVGLDPEVNDLLKQPAAQPDAQTVKKAEDLYKQWKARPERKQLNVETGILGDALGDPAWQGYFAAWLRGGELGDVLYLIEPDSHEQVTLGHFVPLEATEKDKRKLLRTIQREQRKGRLVGLEPKPGGGFRVVGEARQKTLRSFRYKVIKTPGGAFDVARQAVEQIQVAQSTLAVPIEIAVYDPKSTEKTTRSGANALIRGGMRLQGASTPMTMDLKYEPKELWLGKDAEVFGRFWDEKRNPKQALYFQGVEAAEAGKTAEAEALFDRALNSKDEPEAQFFRRLKIALIERARARLFLEANRDADAEKALDRSDQLSETTEWKLLKSRLEIRRGAYDKAFRRLRKGLDDIGGLDSTEGNLLLAIAAKATHHQEEYDRAVKAARESGAEMGLLSSVN